MLEGSIEDIFNRIFYKENLKYVNCGLEENCFYSFLIDNFQPGEFNVDYKTILFADYFVSKGLYKEPRVREILSNYLSFESSREFNINSLTRHGLIEFPRESSEIKNTAKIDERLAKIKPNNSAIMFSSIYGDLFKNEYLLEYVSRVVDKNDLKSLLVLDYVLKGDVEQYFDKVRTQPSIESKVDKILNIVKREYIKSISPAISGDSDSVIAKTKIIEGICAVMLMTSVAFSTYVCLTKTSELMESEKNRVFEKRVSSRVNLRSNYVERKKQDVKNKLAKRKKSIDQSRKKSKIINNFAKEFAFVRYKNGRRARDAL